MESIGYSRSTAIATNWGGFRENFWKNRRGITTIWALLDLGHRLIANNSILDYKIYEILNTNI